MILILDLLKNYNYCQKMITLLLLVQVLFLFAQCRLYQVYSLSRHGSRYHVMDFFDGNQTRPMWAQLTATGMRQLQRMGQLLRKEYIDDLKFLSPNYNPQQIQAYTTRTNRTFMSIQSLLYGLYPPGTGPRLTKVDKSLHLPPYSNKTDLEDENFALPNFHQPIIVKNDDKIILTDCPNYEKYQKQNFDRIPEIVSQMNTYYYPFMKRMSGIFNFSIQNYSLLTMSRCFDASSVDLYLGRRLPTQFTTEDYKNLQHLTSWYFYVAQSNNNGLMDNTFKLQKIMDNFDLRTRLPNSKGIKWTFVSGHDTDVLALHQALNISSFQCTEQLFRKGKTSAVQCQQGGVMYTANVIVQLHSDDEVHFYVKVKSNGRYMKICSQSKYECEYSEFKTLIKKNIATNINQICGRIIKSQIIQKQPAQNEKPFIVVI